MGDLFVEFAPFFKMYLGYVSQFESISKHVFRLADERPRFEKFLECAQDQTLYPDVPSLQSLMIMPVQRIPRYKLLLKEMVKQTPDGHKDLPLLREAIAKTDESARHINAALKRADNQVKIWEIQSMFREKVCLLNSSREYVREGPLLKSNRRGGKEALYFFLFSDILVYGERIDTDPPRCNHRRTVTIVSAEVVDGTRTAAGRTSTEAKSEPGVHADECFCFKVVSPQKELLLFARTERLRQAWVGAIQRCAERMNAVRRDLRARGADARGGWSPSGLIAPPNAVAQLRSKGR